jgi:hypothetical protein
LSEDSSSRAVKYLVVNATVLLVVDLIYVSVSLFVDLPRLTLLAPVILTVTSLFLLSVALMRLNKKR